MGKFVGLLILVAVALFLPRFAGIPGPGQNWTFGSEARAAKSRVPSLGRKFSKALGEAYILVEAGDYVRAHQALDALAASDLNPYERGTILYYHGWVFFLEEDFEASLRSYEELLTLPDLPQMLVEDVKKQSAKLELLIDIGGRLAAEREGVLPTTDASEVPISTVEPLYPREAQMKGIEGSVMLEFTISALGRVVDPVVIESDPPGVFDNAAISAVRKFKYKPKVVNGEAVAVEGVPTLFTFEIAD